MASTGHFLRLLSCAAVQYYSLKQLVLLLEHAEAPMGIYIAACTRQKVKWVASIEKADVLAYLRGQTDDAVQVRGATCDDLAFRNDGWENGYWLRRRGWGERRGVDNGNACRGR